MAPNLFPSLECIIGWDFITSNALQLKQNANGNYVLEGIHGCTPLHPHAPSALAPPNVSVSQLNDGVPPPNHHLYLPVQSVHRSPIPVALPENLRTWPLRSVS